MSEEYLNGEGKDTGTSERRMSMCCAASSGGPA